MKLSLFAYIGSTWFDGCPGIRTLLCRHLIGRLLQGCMKRQKQNVETSRVGDEISCRNTK